MDLIDFLVKKQSVDYLWIDSLSYLPYLKEFYPKITFVEDTYKEMSLTMDDKVPVFLKDYKHLPKRAILTQKKKPEGCLEIKLPFQLKPFLKKFFSYFKITINDEELEQLLMMEKKFDFYHEYLQKELLLDKKMKTENQLNVFQVMEIFLQKKFEALPEMGLKELRFFQQHFYKTFFHDHTGSFYDKLIQKTEKIFSQEERSFFLHLFTRLEILKKNQQSIKNYLIWTLRQYYVGKFF